MTRFGLKDIPISAFEDESLGLKEYAEALTDFVKNCDTPITVALQGDWGSGKTSLMNLIRQDLDKDNNIETVWFNTWQYSQFGQSENLAISLFYNFIDEVCDDTPKKKDTIATIGRIAKWVAKGTGAAVSKHLAGEDFTKEVMSEFADNKEGLKYADSSTQIRNLKSNLDSLVKEKIGSDKRIVVFIDDLDRLVPVKAVELLEALKMFLDIEGCVYILACDYQVVVQGLKEKFGVEGELKGKSFFDKIIQLPFNMPLSQYKVEDYFAKLLKSIGIDFEEKDIPLYVSLVNYSVGFNPRSMKRLFNSLLLLKLVAEKRFQDSDLVSEKSEKMKILFATLCLQNAYEPLYRFLIKSDINDELFSRLTDGNAIKTEDDFKDLRKELNLEKDDSKLRKLEKFMDAFHGAAQLKADDDEDTLSDSEIKNLKAILNFSSVVSTETSTQDVDPSDRYRNRDIAKAFVQVLNKEYADQLKQLNTKGFRLWQAKSRDATRAYVTFAVQTDDKRYFWINCAIDTLDMLFSIQTKKSFLDFYRDWARQHVTRALPDLKFVDGEKFAVIEKTFPPDYEIKKRSEDFKAMARENLNNLFPVLIETMRYQKD